MKISYGTQLKKTTIFRHPYKNVNGEIITDIYHKLTDTQQYLLFNSLPPQKKTVYNPYLTL